MFHSQGDNMFEDADVEKRSSGMPWGMISGLAAFAVLLALGYMMVS
jgi:hypothetical protein